jgi:predicted GNAT family N-acyltransferase
MSLYDENLDVDSRSVHIGAFIDEKLVGVLLLTELNSSEVKMRQVAVNEVVRLKKVGSKMVNFSEEYSRRNRYETIVLNARKTAVEFYLKLGYSIVSDEFLEIKIPHYKMSKKL